MKKIFSIVVLTLCFLSYADKISRPLPPAIDTSKENWLTDRRGIEALDDDFVLPPFSPVKASPKQAEVWGRNYRFNAYGLVENVNILGKDFFKDGMEFEVVINGQQEQFKPEFSTLLRSHKGKAEYLARAQGKNADLEIRTAVEYDGMVKVDFTLIPKGCVEVNQFKYRINYPEEKAKFIHYTGAREGGLSLNVPRSSCSMSLAKDQGKIWESPFKLLVWLGDYEHGFLWFCSSEQNWSPIDQKERADAMKVIRENGKVVLEITPVSSSLLIAKPTTYTWGMFATPVRPMKESWREDNFNYAGNVAIAKSQYGLETKQVYSSGSYEEPPHPGGVSFYPRIWDLQNYRNRVKKVHDAGRLFTLYIDPILMNIGIYKDLDQYKTVEWNPATDNADTETKMDSAFLWQPPELAKFYHEWRKEPVATAPYSKNRGERQFQVGLGSRYADLYCYLIEQHAINGCDGISNLDEWGPVPDLNLRHDTGYLGRDGKIYPEYDWFARRDLLKRMCAVFLKEHKKMPVMTIHTAATMAIPCSSFSSGILSGENFNTAYYSRKSYYDKNNRNSDQIVQSIEEGGRDFLYYAATPDRWFVEMSGKPFGYSAIIMSNLTKGYKIDPEYAKSETATRDLLAMCLIHDNLIFPVFCNPAPAYSAMKIKQDFGIADVAVQFFPYYGQEHPATATGDEIYVVSYRNQDKYMIIIANLSLKDKQVKATLNEKFFKNSSKLINAENKQSVKLSENSFEINIPRRNYCIFVTE